MQVIAWTGGCRPQPWRNVSMEEKALVSRIFQSAMVEVYAYWGDYRGLNDSALEMARIQWKRARYDAHATFRG